MVNRVEIDRNAIAEETRYSRLRWMGVREKIIQLFVGCIVNASTMAVAPNPKDMRQPLLNRTCVSGCTLLRITSCLFLPLATFCACFTVACLGLCELSRWLLGSTAESKVDPTTAAAAAPEVPAKPPPPANKPADKVQSLGFHLIEHQNRLRLGLYVTVAAWPKLVDDNHEFTTLYNRETNYVTV